MSAMMTIALMRAQVQRAQNEGEHFVSVNVLDVLEVLGMAESREHHAKLEKPMRLIGWANPVSLRELPLSRSRYFSKIHRKKSPEHNVEIYISADLTQKCAEMSEWIKGRDEDLTVREADHVPGIQTQEKRA